MNATVVDLRTKMKQVLRALDRRARVTLLCRGKVRGTIIPVENETRVRARDCPMFGMYRKDRKPVHKIMEELRGGRFRDL